MAAFLSAAHEPSWLRCLSLIGVSVALYASAFPPWNFSWACWVALAPLFWTITRLRLRHAVAAGLVWGIASNFAVGYWVPGAIQFYYEQSLWFGWAFCAVTSLIYWSPYYAAFAGLAAWSYTRLPSWVWTILVAALWVTAELARANLLTGAPWLMLGYALAPSPLLRQAADFSGVYGLSFVVALVNLAIVASLNGDRRHAPAIAVVALALLFSYGAWRNAQVLPEATPVTVSVIQGNNQDGARWIPGAYAKGLDEYLRLSSAAAQGQHPQVIVWPEAAVTMFFAREARARQQIAQMLSTADAQLILGAPHYEGTDPILPQFLNSAFVFHADGSIGGRYDKRHLFPFAEYFPLRTIEFLRRRFERVRSFTPGGEATLLETRLGKAAVVICFEAIFPDLVRRTMQSGAHVLINLSNDVWLGDGGGPQQHVAMIRLRAVENHTWVIRATTTGVSAIIDPFGEVVAQSPLFEPAVLNAAIAPAHIATFYQRHGDLFAYFCVSLSLLLLGVGCRRASSTS